VIEGMLARLQAPSEVHSFVFPERSDGRIVADVVRLNMTDTREWRPVLRNIS
jgi:hypothetical protein